MTEHSGFKPNVLDFIRLEKRAQAAIRGLDPNAFGPAFAGTVRGALKGWGRRGDSRKRCNLISRALRVDLNASQHVAVQRVRFIWRSLRRGLPTGWGAIAQTVSVLGLITFVTGLSIAGLPLLAAVAMGLLILVGTIVEGAFSLWRDGAKQVEATNLLAQSFEVSPNPWPTGITRGIIELQIAARQLNQHRRVQGDRWYCEQVLGWLEASPDVLRKSGASEDLTARFTASGSVSVPRPSGRELAEACQAALDGRLSCLAGALNNLMRPQREDGAEALVDALLEQLRRGKRIRLSAPISDDGTSGPIDVWEQEVGMLLENADRPDLATRFGQRMFPERWRGWISGPWSTGHRMDRELLLLSDFIQELQGASAPASEQARSLES